MSLDRLIIRQFVVSSVLLSALPCSSAVRLTRSMQYPALALTNYKLPWKYVPLVHQMPRTMQRRFMWKEMDDTVDGLMGMGTVANGARHMTKGFSPPIIRYRKQPFEFDGQSSKKVKYILKKPPGPPPPPLPPFKRMKMMKFRAPNHQQPSIPLYNHVTIAEPQVLMQLPLPLPSQKPSALMPFMSEEDLRKIEKEQEKRVESESAGEEGAGLDGSEVHEHSHQTHMDDDVVSGRINEFGADWLPMKGPFSTPKSFALSRLHTKVEGIATILTPTAFSLVLSEPVKNKLSYEVTEHSAEASDQKEHTFKPSTFNFDYLIGTTTTTTESPNYPEQFLKTFSNSQDDFQPMRVPITTTTTTPPPSSRRLPSVRTTTEHPFKRYNLHRPKPSKLLFHRTTSSSDLSKPTQTTITTISSTEGSYRVTLELQEPVKTTRESVRTTSEPATITTTTRTTTTSKEPKRSPPEKVRNTRMNSEGKSKLRIKNVSKNEGLNRVLNQHRGSVKFGEKTR